MATATLSDIVNSLPVQFHEKLNRAWNRQAVTLSRLPIVAGRGGSCAFNVNMGGSTAGSVAEGSTVNVASDSTFDALVPATLPWALYRQVFSMTDLEINAAKSTIGGTTAVSDIFQERLYDSITALISQINRDVLTGTGTGGSGQQNIVGFLGGALPVAGNTYANIAVNTYPLWSSNVLANGGVSRPLTVDLLNAGDRAQFTAAGVKADLLIGDVGTYQKYASLFEALRRVNGDGSKQSYGTGANELEFMGSPFIRDKDLTLGNVLMLDLSNVEFRYLPMAEDSMQTATRAQLMMGISSNGTDSSPVNIPVRIWSNPKTADTTSFTVDIYCQLVVRRTNAQVLISDIATV